jgi:hypothetical protein
MPKPNYLDYATSTTPSNQPSPDPYQILDNIEKLRKEGKLDDKKAQAMSETIKKSTGILQLTENNNFVGINKNPPTSTEQQANEQDNINNFNKPKDPRLLQTDRPIILSDNQIKKIDNQNQQVKTNDLNPPFNQNIGQPTTQAKTPPGVGGGGGGGGSMVDANKNFENATMQNLSEQQRILQSQSQFDQQQAQKENTQIALNNQALADADAVRIQQHDQRVEKISREWEDLNNRTKSLSNFEIDPDRIYRDRWVTDKQGNRHFVEGKSKVMALLAGIIGGFGGGATGGVNMGMKALNESIDRDIAMQQAEFNASKSSAEIQNNNFGKLMQVYHDEDSASLALRTLEVDAATRKLQELASGSKSKQVQFNAEKAMAALEQQKAQLEYQFKTQRHDMIARQQAAQASTQSAAQQAAQPAEVSTENFVPTGQRDSNGNAIGLVLGSKEEAAEVRKSMAEAGRATSALDEIARWNNLSASEKLNTHNRARMEQASLMLTQSYGHAVSGTAMSDQEREQLKKTVDAAVSNTIRTDWGGAPDALNILRAQLEQANKERLSRGTLGVQGTRTVTDGKTKQKRNETTVYVLPQAHVQQQAPLPQASLPPPGPRK